MPHKVLRSRPRRRPRPRIRPRGVMEYWSIGVLEYRAESELHPASVGLGCPMGRFDSGICPRTMATNIIQPMKDALRTSSYRLYGTGRFFGVFPGTSYLATFISSLRDKSNKRFRYPEQH